MNHQWVRSTTCLYQVPSLAVVGDYDCDGIQTYVGRACHEGNNLPAKVVPSKHIAFVCWDGQEYTKSNYEVLTGNKFRWVPCGEGYVPPNAVLGGKTVTGEHLYIGRSYWQGTLTVGKVHPSHHCLYIPFGGGEQRLERYEVLICDDRHRKKSDETCCVL